jgi:hypothetical protein
MLGRGAGITVVSSRLGSVSSIPDADAAILDREESRGEDMDARSEGEEEAGKV